MPWDGNRLCAVKLNNASNVDALTELYDHRDDTSPLNLDVAEYNNVAGSHPSIVSAMRKALETYVVYCPPS